MAVKMLTIKEAGKLIEGLSEFRIRQMCLDGTLRSVKAGRKYLICDKVLYETICNPVPRPPEAKSYHGIKPVDLDV